MGDKRRTIFVEQESWTCHLGATCSPAVKGGVIHTEGLSLQLGQSLGGMKEIEGKLCTEMQRVTTSTLPV